jgi:hypothetical protein
MRSCCMVSYIQMDDALALFRTSDNVPRSAPHERARELGHYPTPLWLAEQIVERYFPDLDGSSTVLEPACGEGRFLQVLPAHVSAIGVEVDPLLAQEARRITGRPIITGDFCTVDLAVQSTAIVGNPPFNHDLIDRFLDRAYRLLPEGGRVGLVLPAYYLQTARTVVELAERWSLRQEMVPRNVYDGLSKPLVFTVLSKDRQRVLIGFAFYDNAHAVNSLPDRFKTLLREAPGGLWKSVVARALEELGGRAHLQAIYKVVEGRRPTANKWWRESIRKALHLHFPRVADGVYALPVAA